MNKLKLLKLPALLLALLVATAVNAQEVTHITPPELRVARIDLTVEEVTALNTVPLEVLPVVEGFVYHLEWGQILHTGRYATSPGALWLRAKGTNTVTPFFEGHKFTGFSASAGLVNATTNGNASAFNEISGLGGTSDATTQYGSKAVEVFNSNGNPTVSETFPGSPVTLIFAYRLLPTYVSNLPEIE